MITVKDFLSLIDKQAECALVIWDDAKGLYVHINGSGADIETLNTFKVLSFNIENVENCNVLALKINTNENK